MYLVEKKKRRRGRGSEVLLSQFGRRLRDESDFPLLLPCALWEVMSIQHVQVPPFLKEPYGKGGALRSKKVPI